MSHFFVSNGVQIVGKRDNQEDDFRIVPLAGSAEHAEQLLVVLADGMGGHAAGQVASRIVVESFENFFTTQPYTEPKAMLREALDLANRAVGEEASRTPAYQGMGCTVVAAIFDGDNAWWTSVGDSHLYLLRDRRVERLNADHSYGGYLDQLAALGEDASNPQNLPRNMLMSAIIGEDIPMIDLPETPFQLEGSDRFVLASDGLDTIEREELALRLEPGISPADYASRLIAAVEAANKPRQDNTTVAVVEVRSAARIHAAGGENDPTGDSAAAASGGGGKGVIITVVVVALLVAAAIGAFVMNSKVKVPQEGEQPSGETAGAAGSLQHPESIDRAVTEESDTTEGDELATTGDSAAVEPAATPTPMPLPEPIAVESIQDTLRDGSPGPEMTIIPATTFDMGRNPDPIPTNEHPQHEVTLASYAIARHEVTVGEYNRFAQMTGRPKLETGAANLPATQLGWQDAVDYTDWLSSQTGQRYRLPSEAEWEHAHGAGSINHYWWGIGVPKGLAICFDCLETLGPNRPLPVGSFKPNPYGLYDTAGNVAEWTLDCYHKSYIGAPVDGSPYDNPDCSERVVRGGSFRTPSSALRITARSPFPLETAFEDIGFRVVRDLE